MALEADLTRFHADDYIQFLSRVTPENQHEFPAQLQRCEALMIYLIAYLSF